MSKTLAGIMGAVALTTLATISPPQSRASDPAPGTDGLPALREATRQIDQLLAQDLARQETKPNPRADDATFLRRVYLDVVGRIPDAEETREFLTSKDSRKRQGLIDRLLESPGHVSHNFNYFADLLRIKSRLANRVSGEPYIHWLKSSLATNKPYDEMVHEMISATGPAHRRGNGATGYLLRDRGMPLDNMANTMRIFAGTRMECAQCHDHPFEKWTQRQFFEMAAFTGGLRYVNQLVGGQNGREMRQFTQRLRKEKGEQVYRSLRRQIQGLQAGLGGNGTGLEVLPNDYQYEDAAPGDFVMARTPFGEEVTVRAQIPRRLERIKNPKRRARMKGRAPQLDSRTTFAHWLTSPENPRFTLVIANRMWKRLMGRGVIEPVDDLKEDTRADNPELMAYLTQLMKNLDYDLRSFQRVILNTRTYQRQAWGQDIAPGQPFHFPGPLLRRMSAEQMWDSLLTLVVPDVDEGMTELSPRAEAIYTNYDRLAGKTPQELLAELEGPEGQVMSPRDMARQRAAGQRKKVQPLYRKFTRAQRRNDREAMEEVKAELREMGLDPERLLKQRQYGRDLVRASEIQTPARPGHFLRDFGQSDREQIEGAHTNASVPQALNLLNGFVDEKILARKQGLLVSTLRRERKPDARIRTAYLTILNRSPRPGELKMWRRDMLAEGASADSDLIWTLINSQEFRFIR